MLTREEIISGFKKVDFPDKLFDKSVQKDKTYLLYDSSKESFSKKEKDTKSLSQSYVLPWRLVQKNNPDAVNPKNNIFIRGGNFTPKEPLIDIKIENFKLIYDKYLLPLDKSIIYVKNTYGGINGPFNYDQISNLYKNKKMDSSCEFRFIDIFSFDNSDLFTFKSLKIINDIKYVDSIIPSPLLSIFNDSKKEVKKIEVKKEEKIKPVEEKKEEKPKEIKKEEKKIVEEKWELVEKKKNKKKEKEKEEDKNNEIIGLKNKESKEGNKKGKKKKKPIFEDTNVDLGFQVK